MSKIVRKCPVCSAPTAEASRPFCSQRCADIDLGRWITGSYRIASAEPIDEEELDALSERPYGSD
ncbi:MAG: DNA gyrase inhibitor YacG [Pseudomonadota bacterium]